MDSGPAIKLEGGPEHGQVFNEKDFRARIKAAQRMHHTDPDGGPGSALGYAPDGVSATGQPLWSWHNGINCHPADPNDPDLAPYGAAYAAEFHRASENA
jgi:hypothetical protein